MSASECFFGQTFQTGAWSAWPAAAMPAQCYEATRPATRSFVAMESFSQGRRSRSGRSLSNKTNFLAGNPGFHGGIMS